MATIPINAEMGCCCCWLYTHPTHSVSQCNRTLHKALWTGLLCNAMYVHLRTHICPFTRIKYIWVEGESKQYEKSESSTLHITPFYPFTMNTLFAFVYSPVLNWDAYHIFDSIFENNLLSTLRNGWEKGRHGNIFLFVQTVLCSMPSMDFTLCLYFDLILISVQCVKAKT